MSFYFFRGNTPTRTDTRWNLLAKLNLNTSGLTLSAGGSVGRGTTAARDATTPTGEAIWILTDSVPPYQLSVWNGSSWI